MQRFSKPTTNIQAEYDVVIVGSGYGGSVAASRLSRSGRSVAVLEKGIEFLPNDFIVGGNELQALQSTHVTYKKVSYGQKTKGGSSLSINDDITVATCRGLGGGSTFNAAVMMKPDPRVFQSKLWPTIIRDDIKCGKMDEYYRRATEMLRPSSYPNHFPTTDKTKFFQNVATDSGFGRNIHRPLLAVSYKATASNHVGIPQAATDLSGDFCFGNRSNAKNSTITNYIPDACRHGASFFCGVEVQYIIQDGPEGGYVVVYKDHDLPDGKELFVRAKLVIIAGGPLGTSSILFRSMHMQSVDVSDNVGKRFSGNGAMTAIVGAGNASKWKSVTIVPSGKDNDAGKLGVYIDSILDLRSEERPLEEGVILEESVWPAQCGVPQLTIAKLPTSIYSAFRMLKDIWFRKAAALVLMCVGHDDADAEIKMAPGDNVPSIVWNSTEIEDRNRAVQREALGRLAKVVDGSYSELPLGVRLFSKRITAHPLGGSVMSEDPSDGVVDHIGRVYRKDGSVHTGLMVVDSSVIPSSLGTNPALTITALAERSMHMLALENGWIFDTKLEEIPMQLSSVYGESADVQFVERMAGYIAICGDKVTNFTEAREQGKLMHSPFEFTVKIVINKLGMENQRGIVGSIFGTAIAPALSPYPLMVNGGTVKLFIEDSDDVYGYRMCYTLPLTSRQGNKVLLVGEKIMHEDHGVNVVRIGYTAFKETTSLQCTLYCQNGEIVLGRGILTISIFEVFRMISTIKGPEAFRFQRLFLRNLASIYLCFFKGIQSPSRREVVFFATRQLRAPKPQFFEVRTDDCFNLPVLRYKGGSRGVVVLIHGYAQSGAVFAIDTIEENLVEALCKKDFDVWVCNIRIGLREEHTLDDVAKFDYPAIFDLVEAETDPDTRLGGIHVLAHCVGGVTFSMSVLGGHVAPERIKSIGYFQWGAYVSVNLLSYAKAASGLVDIVLKMGFKTYHAPRDPCRGIRDMILDLFARLFPIVAWDFRTNSLEQARAYFLYGALWSAANMNRLTIKKLLQTEHRSININSFSHLTRILTAGFPVDANGNDIYMPQLSRLVNIPATLFAGGDNRVLQLEGSAMTVNALTKEAMQRGLNNTGGDWQEIHRLHVIEGYGHLDFLTGSRAHIDVYPAIIAHLETWNRKRPHAAAEDTSSCEVVPCKNQETVECLDHGLNKNKEVSENRWFLVLILLVSIFSSWTLLYLKSQYIP